MNLRYLFIGIVSLYGLLSMIAAIGGMMEDGVQGQFILFLLAAAMLMVCPWIPHTLVWLLMALAGLHIAAILQGLDQGELQWSHHAVRAIISFAIVFLYIRVEE